MEIQKVDEKCPRQAKSRKVAERAENLRRSPSGVTECARDLLHALDERDAAGAQDILEVSCKASRLGPVLNREYGARIPRNELMNAWKAGNFFLTVDDERDADRFASNLVAAFAQSGDVGATGALLGCLGPRAAIALVSQNAFAVYSGNPGPEMVSMLLSYVSPSERTKVVVGNRGQIITSLLRYRNHDFLIQELLDDVIKRQDAALAARLLNQTQHLLVTAIRGKRITGTLEALVAMAGPEFVKIVQDRRATARWYSQGDSQPVNCDE